MYLPLTATQHLCEHTSMAMSTHATIKELLHASYSMWSVSYKRKVGNEPFPELLALMNAIYITEFILKFNACIEMVSFFGTTLLNDHKPTLLSV